LILFKIKICTITCPTYTATELVVNSIPTNTINWETKVAAFKIIKDLLQPIWSIIKPAGNDKAMFGISLKLEFENFYLIYFIRYFNNLHPTE